MMCCTGEGVGKDMKKAVKLYAKAAAQDNIYGHILATHLCY